MPLVLVIEDDDDARRLCAEALRGEGYAVEEAPSWREAWALVHRLHPDAVVLDRQLADVDGWDTARQLKGDARTQSIPVIALTAHADQPSVLGALEAGCDAFLAKPCDPDALFVTLRKLLRAPGAITGARKRPDHA